MTILDEKAVAYFKNLEAGIAKANKGIDDVRQQVGDVEQHIDTLDMGTSRAIALALGWPGLIAAGVLTIAGLSGGNYPRVTAAVIYIAGLRAKQKMKRLL